MATSGFLSAYKIVTPFENGLTDGQVKINNGNGVKPRWDNTTVSINGVWRAITYTLPLGLSSFPTTSWPANKPTPTDADIYLTATNTFIENTVPGQVNFWRLQFDYVKSSTQSELQIRIRNTLSGFILNTFVTFVAGQTSGNFSVLMVTVADGASLPPPYGAGQGYLIEVQGDDSSFQGVGSFLEVNSILRINTSYADIHY